MEFRIATNMAFRVQVGLVLYYTTVGGVGSIILGIASLASSKTNVTESIREFARYILITVRV